MKLLKKLLTILDYVEDREKRSSIRESCEKSVPANKKNFEKNLFLGDMDIWPNDFFWMEAA